MKEKCDCENCEIYRKVLSLQNFLITFDKNSSEVENHINSLEDLYSRYVHQGIDYEHLKAIVENSWPSSEVYMKSYGWVREETECQNV